VIGVSQRTGTIMIVSSCLLYLIFGQLLAWIFGEKGGPRATGSAGHPLLATLTPRLWTTGQITAAAGSSEDAG
jgi:hypothetical protein